MNKLAFIPLITLLYLIPAISCPAHSVHVFAHAENGIIKGEGYLSGGKKVVNGDVQIFNKENNELLFTTQTDKQGLFSISTDELNQDHAVDLIIVLNAGPGHRSQWELAADQYAPVGRSEEAAESVTTHAHDAAPAVDPPLINIVAGIVCILGLGGIIAFIKSRKRGSS